MTGPSGDFTTGKRTAGHTAGHGVAGRMPRSGGVLNVPVPRAELPVSERVELRLSAELDSLPIVRSVAANVAAMLDHDLDAISDLTLAVNEVCSTLIGLAAPKATLACVFAREGGSLCFEAHTAAKGGDLPDTGSFAWRVLATLTDRAACWSRRGEDGSPVVGISVRRERTAGVG
ncbi:ATP-binding protein [Actinokineospora iranica]|nr:ATP-binding protein [Actinokineospora iranica]